MSANNSGRKSLSSRIATHTGNAVTTIFLASVAFCVYLVVLPLLGLLLIPLYLSRYLVKILCMHLHPNWVGMMSTRDAIVGLDDVTRKSECMINVMMTYQGVPDLTHLRAVFQDRVINYKNSEGILCYSKLKQYFEPWLGFPFWKWETDFSVEKHVRWCEAAEDLLSTKSSKTNKVSGYVHEEDLLKIIGDLTTKPFLPEMSPWEVLFVRNYVPASANIHKDYIPNDLVVLNIDNYEDNYNNNNNDNLQPDITQGVVPEHKPRFAMIIRIHHAIGDGFSIMKLIMSNLSKEPMEKIPTAAIRRSSVLTQIFTYVVLLFVTPYYHLKQFILEVDRNLWHLSEKKLSHNRLTTMTEKISLKKLKGIAKREGVSVTAVLLAGFSGGIHRYLRSQGVTKDKIPKVMRGLSPMPWKNHPMEALVNHWTVGIFAMPVGNSCSNGRIQEAEEYCGQLKKSPILMTNFGTVPLMLGVPSWLTDFWATNWMTTMIMSNFPGPSHAIWGFDQYLSEDVVFWLPQMRGSASIGVSFLSYNGGIRIALSIDKAIISQFSDAAQLTELITEEFHRLKSAQITQQTDV